MNMDEKREALRKHLKSGYRKINDLNAKTRKVKTAKGLVMLKRDKILRQMEEELNHVLRAIEEMKIKFEQELEGVVAEKVSELDSEVDEVQEDICMLMEICVESEKTLKLGNEEWLEEHSKALVTSFEMLFETYESFVDYDQLIVMDFKSYNISDTVIKKGLGYIVTKENEGKPMSNFMISVGTQVNDVSRRTDMATQTVGVNQILYPPLTFANPALLNPQSMLMASQNYRPYISGGNNYYLNNQQLMSAAYNYPMNVNQNNFPAHPSLRSTLPYGYLPRLPTILPETNQPFFTQVSVTKDITQQSVTKETTQPSVSQVSEPQKSSKDCKSSFGHLSSNPTLLSVKNPVSSMSTGLPMAPGMNMDTVDSSAEDKCLVNEKEADASYVPKQKRLPRLPGAKTIDRLISSTNSNLVTSKLKIQTSSEEINDEGKTIGKPNSFSFRFSPTSSSTPSLNDENSKTTIGSLHLPQNMHELKQLQTMSDSESSVANNKEVKYDMNKNKLVCPSTVIKSEAKSEIEGLDSLRKEIKEGKLTEKSLANESWDEELVSLPDHYQIPGTTCDQKVVKKEAIIELKVASLYPSWHGKVGDQGNSHTVSHNDSGISLGILALDTLDKEVGNAQETKPTLNPMENKSAGQQQSIFKTESRKSKTMNLTHFKSMFEKHIESNDNVPKSGHMVGTGASYHIDQNDNHKAETQKPKEKQVEKNTKLCICTLICRQSNWKEIEAFLVYKAGKLGKGAMFAETLNYPIGVAVNSKNEIIVNDTSNHLVKSFKKDKLVNVMGLGDVQMQRPSAVVVNKNDEVFVKDNCAVHVFDKSGRYKFSFGKDKLKQPYGLVMTEDETLLVLDTQRPAPCLYEFHQNGRLIACHPYQPLEKSQSMSKCRFMAYHAGKLLVSDLGRSMMYLTNRTGEMIHQFAKFGRGDGEFNEPSGVTVDYDGHWIVADSKNHRVQVFKPNGDFISVIKFKEPIIRPSDIHWTDDGLLVIVDFLAHSFKVFQLKKT